MPSERAAAVGLGSAFLESRCLVDAIIAAMDGCVGMTVTIGRFGFCMVQVTVGNEL